MRDDLYPAKRVKLLAEPVRVDDVRANILRALALMDETMTVANTVLAALKPWHNNRINKKIAVTVQKALSTYSVYYSRNQVFKTLELRIWANAERSFLQYGRNEMVLTLTREPDDSVFDIVWFEREQVSRYVTRNAEKCMELTEQLAALDEKVNAYNAALPGMREVISGLGQIHQFAFEG